LIRQKKLPFQLKQLFLYYILAKEKIDNAKKSRKKTGGSLKLHSAHLQKRPSSKSLVTGQEWLASQKP
jgi:hypothetical protein